ncbi:MAG: RNA 2',3'-cyclic phosphodiesterase [Phycisphaerales bacterium JB039]
MARPQANLRLFAAIYPPIEVARAALRAIRGLDLPDHRATPAEQVHLTAQFIGDTPVKDLDGVLESVRRSASGVGAFALKPLRYITLPRGKRPRLIALETDAPAQIMELHRRLAHRLATSPRADGADRFLPHLTLARFRPGPARPLEAEADLPAFEVDAIVVMRSVLRPEGAEHKEVERIAL